MIPALDEIVGMPPETPPAELDLASEKRFLRVLRSASLGDAQARHELLQLRLAYLNWAYAGSHSPAESGAVRWV